MHASELRIGNYIRKGIRHGKVTASDIHDLNKVNLGFNDSEYVKSWKEISINEEWLFNLGFNDDFKQYDLQNNGLKVIKDIHSDSWICYVGFLNDFFELCLVKFIHELQNLYFALTGEELELKSESKP